MKLLDVYPVFDIHPVKGEGATLTDNQGNTYLDLYGGHAVISIGHSHPYYVKQLQGQMGKLGYYSNSVRNELQENLANRLGTVSGCEEYRLFLCNSGAEANENALKMASFHTGRSRVIAFQNGFHGRTSAAVAATDNEKIKAPINRQHQVAILPFNQLNLIEEELAKNDVCAVLLECIQGVGGLDKAEKEFTTGLSDLCKKYGAVLIADEVQSGFGRTGKFFAFQHYGIEPGIITMAKGMGNGFPVGGILVAEDIKAEHGMLGTTFGGNHLACTASLAVLKVLEDEGLLLHATDMEEVFRNKAKDLNNVRVKGSGLMLGLEFNFEIKELRKKLVYEYGILTGSAKNPHVLRILPPLTISKEELLYFFNKLNDALK